DDFGTGYSSMSYLTQLPLNVLKIDRSFVNDMETIQGAAIVKAVVALAKGLSLKVVAEGVETKEQLERLKELSCDYVQGFYYSKPLDNDVLEKRFFEDFGYRDEAKK
ncbi:MAG: EAL domain-containing protein, partial [Pseudomonadales bacterium]|nr:EAL domain-containing protein [Pseudomonadales bacterium]